MPRDSKGLMVPSLSVAACLAQVLFKQRSRVAMILFLSSLVHKRRNCIAQYYFAHLSIAVLKTVYRDRVKVSSECMFFR